MSGSYAITPNFGLKKPVTGADDGLWGTHWNANADTLDATLKQHADAIAANVPVGGPFLPIAGGALAGPGNLTVGGTLNTTNAAGFQQNGSTILNVFGSGDGSGANTLVGYQAGLALPGTDNESTFVGYRAGWSTSGTQLENTYVGWSAGSLGTTAQFNAALGVNALGHNVTSSNVVALGNDAIRNSLTVPNSIAIGSSAMRDNNQSFSVAIGTQALQGVLQADPPGNPSSSGSNNIAIGFQSLRGPASTTITNNIAIGPNTAPGITSANNNIIVGSGAGQSITSGPENLLLGTLAGTSLTTAFGNVMIGHLAGRHVTGATNILIGDQVGQSITTGHDNIVIGTSAAKTNLTTGSFNIIVGFGPNADTAAGATNNTFAVFGPNAQPIILVTNTQTTTPAFFLPGLAASPSYANDAAAAGSGVGIGQLYRNGSAVQVRVT